MLEKITPVILTYNEEEDIARVLDAITWAKDIVIVDSFSTDETMNIIKNYPGVRTFQRKFDSHSEQWNYAIKETGIKTDWVLALDSDYVLTKEIVSEITRIKPLDTIAGYEASFLYCIFGQPLRGTLYPPVTVLYKRKNALYIQDGHTQRIKLFGDIGKLSAKIFHDDRKPLSSWLQAQDRYMELEAVIINNTAFGELSFNDRVRKLIFLAPPLTFFYCLIVRLGIFDGKAGLYYAFQRSLAETILSLKLIEKIIKNR